MAYRFADSVAARLNQMWGIPDNFDSRDALINLQIKSRRAEGEMDKNVDPVAVREVMQGVIDYLGAEGVKTIEVQGRTNGDFGSVVVLYVDRGEDCRGDTLFYDTEDNGFWIADLEWMKKKVGVA